MDRAERTDRARFLIPLHLQRRPPSPPPQLPDSTSPPSRPGHDEAAGPQRFPVFGAPGLVRCIIYEANFSNLSTGYGSRCEDWPDRSARRVGRRRRWMLGTQEAPRRRGEMFEEQVAGRLGGDAGELSALCGDAVASGPVRWSRRG